MQNDAMPSSMQPLHEWYEEKGWDSTFLSRCRFSLTRMRAEAGFPEGHVQTYHGTPPDEDMIRGDHGRGYYDLSVLSPDERGKMVIASRRYVSVSGPALVPVAAPSSAEAKEQSAKVEEIRAKSEASIQEQLMKRALGEGGSRDVVTAIEKTTELRVEMAKTEAERQRERAEAATKEMERMGNEFSRQIAEIIASHTAQVTELLRQGAEKEKALRDHYAVLMDNQKTQLATSHSLEKAALERERDMWKTRADEAERAAKKALEELNQRLRQEAETKDPAAALTAQMGLFEQWQTVAERMAAIKGDGKAEDILDKVERGVGIARDFLKDIKEDAEDERTIEKIPREVIVTAITTLVGGMKGGASATQAAQMAVQALPGDVLKQLLRYEAGVLLDRVKKNGLLPNELDAAMGRAYVKEVWAAAKKLL